MKNIYPLLTLLSAAVVAAGPVPRYAVRSNTVATARLHARTEHVVAPVAVHPPMPEAVNAEAEKQRLADEKAGK